MQNAEAEDQPPQVARFARFDAVEEIARRLFAHALDCEKLVERERVEVGDILDQAELRQLQREHVAAALNIHRAARAPMNEPALELRGTIRIDAAPIRGGRAIVIRTALNWPVAFRAFRGKGKDRFASG